MRRPGLGDGTLVWLWALIWLLLMTLVPVAFVTAAVVSGIGWQLIPALWVAFLGYTFIGWKRLTPPSKTNVVIGIASFLVAAILVVPMAWAWSNLVAGVWYLVFLAGPGALRHHL